MNILYTTEAVVEGGRAGHGRTSDGRLAVELSVPKELGGEGGPGTNPEQLFAVGYAACFHSGLLSVARGRKLDASDSTVTAQVGIGPTGHGGFGLAVTLDLHAPKLSRVDAEDLMRRAHERCPLLECHAWQRRRYAPRRRHKVGTTGGVPPSSRSLNTDEFEHDSPRIHHRRAIEPAAVQREGHPASSVGRGEDHAIPVHGRSA